MVGSDVHSIIISVHPVIAIEVLIAEGIILGIESIVIIILGSQIVTFLNFSA
jgi:hypothetical protein